MLLQLDVFVHSWTDAGNETLKSKTFLTYTTAPNGKLREKEWIFQHIKEAFFLIYQVWEKQSQEKMKTNA